MHRVHRTPRNAGTAKNVARQASGEGALVAYALTEPGYGIGIDLHTTAAYLNGRFVLNGKKHLITFRHEAAVMIVMAKMDESEVLGEVGRARRGQSVT